MILYHGSRTHFEQFDTDFFGTGEGTQLPAFWFTDNFNGAANHARMITRYPEHIPSVYTCHFPDNLPIVSLGVPLSEQPYIHKLLKVNLPLLLSFAFHPVNRHWACALKAAYEKIAGRHIADAEMIELFFTRCGIAGAHHWQGDSTYTRYMGRCTIIFAGAAKHINIINVNFL